MKPTSLATAGVCLAVSAAAPAFDLNDNLSLGVILALTGQCQKVSGGDAPDSCRGAAPLQLDGSLRPAEGHELGFKLGFAGGNGLNPVLPFVLAPWAADLEDDVQDINGRSRDYLLTAWYRYETQLAADSKLGTTVGIIDATDFLDGNAYANDEYTQFMNEAFVNSGSYGLPSYDWGAAVHWIAGDWSAAAIGMNVGENDDGNNYNLAGAQIAYHAATGLGEGNYRLIFSGTNRQFLDPTGTRKEDQQAVGLSFDQALGEMVGAFLRVAWRNEDALIDYRALYSAGLSFDGTGWGRAGDNVGIGYAYLPGGNSGLDRSQVAEAYYRLALWEGLSITADLQWLADRYDSKADGEDLSGWIVGLRLTAAF